MEIKNLESIFESTVQDLEKPVMSPQQKENIKWLRENRNSLSRYENNWIAIHKNAIISFSPNPDELEKQLEEENHHPKDVLIHYLVNSNCIF